MGRGVLITDPFLSSDAVSIGIMKTQLLRIWQYLKNIDQSILTLNLLQTLTSHALNS